MSRQPAEAAPLKQLVPGNLFKAEVWRWVDRIGVQPKEIHLRPMTRKWASCSSRGRLTFDTELLRQPQPFRTQVIVHELVHLKVPNHGKLFRNLVRAYLSGNGTVKDDAGDQITEGKAIPGSTQ